MKSILSLSLAALLLASCSTSNDVVGGVFQKRKYNKGFYWNRGGVQKTVKAETESDLAVTEKTEEIRTLDKRTVNAVETDNKELAAMSVIPASAATETENTTVSQKSNKPAVRSEVKEKTAVSSGHKTLIREKKGKSISQLLNKKQKSQSGSDSSAMFILAVIFAILIPPLGVLIYTNIDWMKVLICLLLTILFFLPGMIYALLVVFDVI